MSRRNESRPDIHDDETPTEQPVVRRLHAHGIRLDEQAVV